LKNILVSGASGIVGYGILRSLKRSGKELRLIGTTIYDDSVAAAFSDVFEKALLTSDPNYLDWLLKLLKKQKIDMLIPGIEADMYKWVQYVPEIQDTGARILLNNVDLISLCKDKWKFYESLMTHKSPNVIPSSLSKDFDELVAQFGLPFLLKPRQGYGSRGIFIVGSKEKYLNHADDVGENLMAQKIVGDINEEFTTSAFCDGIGGFHCYMTLKRKLSSEGFTEKAVVVELENIETVLASLCQIYKPVGPTNFQFRRQDGILKLLEINPRISSSTSIRSAFGYNESQMSVDYFLEGIQPVQPDIRMGKAVRYFEDYIFYS
jgi:carbamoyl-phosphate synthase large subunit